MTKVKGSHFCRAMENNFIQISGGTIRIHSFDKNGLGLLRNEPNEFKEAAEELRFYLNKADMNVLTKFEDLDIQMTGNTIHCKSGPSSFRLQNTTDVREMTPYMKELTNLNIDLSDYSLAASFAGKVPDDGVLVADTGITMFDSADQFIFRQIKELELEKMINIPTGILKLIDKTKPYMIMTNAKIVVLRTAGEIVYGPLFLKLFEPAVKLDPKLEGHMKIFSTEDFKKHIKLASSFDAYVTLSIKEKILTMESGVAGGTNERAYKTSMAVETNVAEYSRAFTAAGILRVLDAIDAAGEITLYFDNKSIMGKTEKRFAIISGYNSHDNIDMILQEAMDERTEQ